MNINEVAQENIKHFFVSDDYVLLEKIGEGGFGEVYKAKKINTGQYVAIKFLKLNPDYDKEKKSRYLERFNREVLLASQLQHPNIIRLLDKGQCDGDLVYAVFEYADGQSLRDYLNDCGKISAVDAVDVMGQVLDALSHAHENGIVHRDIKPSNIMLLNIGAKIHVKILDFGIGALLHDARSMDYKTITLAQESLGTPSYSAPEQLRGEPPSAKTDLYVWGLVFIECMTGNPAMSGSSLASIFHKQLSPSNVPLPIEIVGHPLAALLQRVLQKKPAERMESAAAVYGELQRINVGNILSSPTAKNDETPDISSDETLISDASLFYTELTEKKQITILCLSLGVRSVVGDELDFEVVDTLHRDQHLQCRDIAVRYGASHIGTLGDTSLFYFGYPVVSENDGRLSARTALDIVGHINKRNSLLQYSQGFLFEARVGLHSGLFTAYTDSVPEGNAANTAMQLCRAAHANEILCSDTFKKIVDNYIEFEPKELSQDAAVPRGGLYTLKAERMVEAFGFLRANRHHQHFVGREEQLDTLLELIDDEAGQRSGYAHVYGEAGIGKSRLVAELRGRAGSASHFVAQCLPEYEHNALFPFLNLFRHLYALSALGSEETVLQLRGIIQQHSELDEAQILPILCTWLYLPVPDDMPMVAYTPEKQKQLLFKALVLFFTHHRDGRAVDRTLFIVEDIHWADPVSLEFVRYLVDCASQDDRQKFLLTTSRHALPEALQESSCRPVEVLRLTTDQTKTLIGRLFDGKTVSERVLDIVSNRTDGVPLFVEELINMLQQKGLVHHLNGVVDFTDPKRLDEIPNTLRDSLQQKLDGLVSAKELVQFAAAIGREFDHQLLLLSANHSEEKVQADLEELIAAELVYIQRKVDGDSYIFKHALVRDAAYESIPAPQKRLIHQKIAESLESRSTDDHQDSGLLAMHWASADVYEKAVEYGTDAANSALKRSASSEAIAQAEKVKDWIANLVVEEQLEPKLSIYSVLTSAYMEVKGWASEEVLSYSNKSLELLKANNRNDELVSHLWWKILNGIVGGRREGLAALSDEMEPLLEQVGDINKSAIRCAQGFFQFTHGDRGSCISSFVDAIRYYGESPDLSHQQIYGFDISVFAMATLARAYADTSEKAEALHYSGKALSDAKKYEHVPSIGIALMYYGIVHQQYKNIAEVKSSSAELIAISERYNLPIYKAFGQMLYDWSIGDTTRSLELHEFLTTAGSMHGLAHFQSFYAETFAANGHVDQAVEVMQRCLSADKKIGENNYKPYLALKMAEFLSMADAVDMESVNQWLDIAKSTALHQGVDYVVVAVDQLEANLLVEN